MNLTPEILAQAAISGLLMGGVYALVAIGLTMQWGVMNIVNFAHGEFMMLAMYLSYWAFALLGIDPYVSLLLSVPIMFLLGALTQRVLIERVMNANHVIQILLTVGLGIFLENLALYLWSPNFRTIKLEYLSATIRFGEISIGITKLIAFAVCGLLAASLYLLLKKTTLGRAMRAVAQDAEGAALMGINVKRMYMLAFGIGSACVGAAGTLVIPFFYTHPKVGLSFVLMAFVVAVLGSLGNFVGALVGGLIIGLSESISGLILPGTLKELVTFSIFILVLLFRTTGLFGREKL